MVAVWMTKSSSSGVSGLADLDDYAAHVKATEASHAMREDRLSIVNRVWSYRGLLPEADRLPQTPPWRGERIQDILQQRRGTTRPPHAAVAAAA